MMKSITIMQKTTVDTVVFSIVFRYLKSVLFMVNYKQNKMREQENKG